MNTQTKRNQKGFTIIEVVLVLAIAGLIFLMVFIALPALQRGQRDTQRRSDAATFISQINSYMTNNRGNVPDEAKIGTFAKNYLKWAADDSGEFNDPKTGVGYIISGSNNSNPVPKEGEMIYKKPGTCNGEELASSQNNREVAVVVKLEGAGVFCKSNK